MLVIKCPICGDRDYTEFNYGGDASVVRPSVDELDHEAWEQYVFSRCNPRGWHEEYWHHVHGCRSWLIVERNTQTHEVRNTSLAQVVQQKGNAAGTSDVRTKE